MLKQLLAALFGPSTAASPVVSTGTIAGVSALATGQLLLNGQPVTASALDAALADLKAKHGVVWY